MVVRLVNWAAILTVALLVAAAGAVAFLSWRAMPDYLHAGERL